jgi:hypothetical protein
VFAKKSVHDLGNFVASRLQQEVPAVEEVDLRVG